MSSSFHHVIQIQEESYLPYYRT